ncbi:hypothetical protein L3X38_037812 [Prunus dulcis]|uniref:Uncharacterized protein n=1 Tax=Prunus dulcis TaxID=3755 RepID=A0AAD4V443_PRUDU|nr:hypothetical protein L3X38_037812 [Prunus dulcis]
MVANEPIVEEDKAKEGAADKAEANAMEKVAKEDKIHEVGFGADPLAYSPLIFDICPRPSSMRFAYLPSPLIIEKENPWSE